MAEETVLHPIGQAISVRNSLSGRRSPASSVPTTYNLRTGW
jgi:hypothetical protein